jgi:hypothetical protein
MFLVFTSWRIKMDKISTKIVILSNRHIIFKSVLFQDVIGSIDQSMITVSNETSSLVIRKTEKPLIFFET